MKTLLSAQILAYALAFTQTLQAQVIPLSSQQDIYRQDFDSLGAASFTNHTQVPVGWWIEETGFLGDSKYRSDDGLFSFADTYSYGTGTNRDRALGGIADYFVQPVFGARFVNRTGSIANRFSYSVAMEQWRGGGRFGNDSLLFSYRINSGAWVSLRSHALTSKVVNPFILATRLDGNLHQNRRYNNFTVTGITWNAGDTLTIRWEDKDLAIDDALAIDHFKLTISDELPVLVEGAIPSTWDIVSPQKIELASDVTVSGSGTRVLIVRAGASLDALGYTIDCDSVYIYGTLATAHANGLTGTFGFAGVLFGTGSTIRYAGSGGTQTITPRTDYANMELSGNAIKRFSNATYEIGGNFEVTGSAPVYGTSTVMRFNGTTQIISCPSFNNVEFTNSGTKMLGVATQVINTLTLADSAVLASNGNLTLVSNAGGTARVTAIPETASITGDVTVQRYVPAVVRRSRMISPNVANFTFADIKDDIFVTGSGSTTNGFDASGPNQATIYTFQESGSRGWKAISNINNMLDPGKGALVFVRGDRTLPAPQWYTAPYVAQNAVTIDFTGTLNQGTISPSLTYTNTGSSADDGWNMVGNPYASQINWNSVTKSNLSAFYYVLNPSTGSYVAQSGNSYIASGQAFFVEAIADNPSITFSESNKVSNSSTGYFNTSTLPFEVRMVKDSVNSDVAWLSFNSNASANYSPQEDAIKLTNAAINLGFYLDSNTMLQYHAVPAMQATDTFTLSAMAAVGTYTLEFSNVNSSSQTQMFLRDLFTNNIIDLQSTSSYPFSISLNPASKSNRFQVIYTDLSRLSASWLGFSGDRSEENVLLKWATASGNNNGFSIEKAEQGSEVWTVIGFVNGKGNSNTVSNYSAFVDARAFTQSDVLYYRIKQIDHNGAVSYSQVIRLRSDKGTNKVPFAVTVYPNPAQSDLYANFTPALTGATVEITDSYGKTMLVQENINGLSLHMNVAVLPAGVYILKVSQSGEVAQIFKFVKQ